MRVPSKSKIAWVMGPLGGETPASPDPEEGDDAMARSISVNC